MILFVLGNCLEKGKKKTFLNSKYLKTKNYTLHCSCVLGCQNCVTCKWVAFLHAPWNAILYLKCKEHGITKVKGKHANKLQFLHPMEYNIQMSTFLECQRSVYSDCCCDQYSILHSPGHSPLCNLVPGILLNYFYKEETESIICKDFISRHGIVKVNYLLICMLMLSILDVHTMYSEI